MAPRSPWKLNNLCVFTNMSLLLLSLYNTQDHLTLEYTQSGSFCTAGCRGCSENLSSPYSTASALGAALPVPFCPSVCWGCCAIFISPYSTSSALFCTCLPCWGLILMSAYINSCPSASSAEEHKHVFNPGRCQVAYEQEIFIASITRLNLLFMDKNIYNRQALNCFQIPKIQINAIIYSDYTWENRFLDNISDRATLL